MLHLASFATSRRKTAAAQDGLGESAPVPEYTFQKMENLKRVILAEKPSVARDIARVLKINIPKKNLGFFMSDDKEIAITWAFGHLVDWIDEEQKATSWSKKSLPILPTNFILQEKTTDGKPDPRIHAQLDLISNFFRSAEEIVVATDAGREGELIFRLIYEMSGASTPFRRFWVSSQTDAAIREGFSKLRPGAELDPLYRSAWCRKAADWIVGINATKVYTIYYKGKGPFASNSVLSVGRVQTPVLRMLVDRFREREAFVPRKFWELLLDCVHEKHRFSMKWLSADTGKTSTGKGKSSKRNALSDEELVGKEEKEETGVFYDNEEVRRIAAALSSTCVVKSFKKEKKTERSPPLYDLTGLQKDCNKRYGWSADFTLNTLQALYETHKLVTYPRTSSRYLNANMVPMVTDVLNRLAPSALRAEMLNEKISASNDRVYNDAKVRDHFAIIPTGEKINGKLKDAEEKLFAAITARFFAAFLPDAKKEQTELIASNAGQLFRATGTNLVVMGWRSVYQQQQQSAASDTNSSTASSTTTLPANITVGTSFSCKLPPTVEQGETAPPPDHTEASLLHLMETAGKQIEDEDLRDAIKDCGIGTPSTRAAIIEKLIRHGYVIRQRNYLIPTKQGLGLIDFLKNTPLAQPELTGRWESRLQKMELGKEDKNTFMKDIRTFANDIVADAIKVSNEIAAKQPSASTEEVTVIGICPVCNDGMVRNVGRSWKCTPSSAPSPSPSSSASATTRGRPKKGTESTSASPVEKRKKCEFWVAKSIAGVEITPQVMTELVENGRTRTLTGFMSKAQKRFNASLEIKADGKVGFRFDNSK